MNVKEHSRVCRALIQTRDRQLPFGRKIKMRIVHTKLEERAKIAKVISGFFFFKWGVEGGGGTDRQLIAIVF